MRIAIICNDTRGGVQPYIGLASALVDREVSVKLVVPAHLSYLVASSSFDVSTLTINVDEFNDVRARIGQAGVLRQFEIMFKEVPRKVSLWMKECFEACAGCDAIVAGIGGMGLGISVAEKINVPFYHCHVQPIFAPSRLYPPVLFPQIPLSMPGFVANAGHYLSDSLAKQLVVTGVEQARKSVLGLSKSFRTTFSSPMLYGFSPEIAQVESSGDLRRVAAGYWFAPPEKWVPPQALETFLDENAGNMLCVGFGSMPGGREYDLNKYVHDAVKKTGLKAVVLGGGGAVQCIEQDANCYYSNELPHEFLFPKMRVVVHHGGAGTTGAVLRAGVPSIIVPFGMDQPFWANRIQTLQLGLALSKKNCSSDRLAKSITSLLDDSRILQNAHEIALRIHAEDGAGRTADEIIRAIKSRRSAP